MPDTPTDKIAELIARAEAMQEDVRRTAIADGLREISPGIVPEFIAALRDTPALIAHLGADGWQPIETAPKDGTAVLIWPGSYNAVVIARWEPMPAFWGVAHLGGGACKRLAPTALMGETRDDCISTKLGIADREGRHPHRPSGGGGGRVRGASPLERHGWRARAGPARPSGEGGAGAGRGDARARRNRMPRPPRGRIIDR